MIFTTVFSWSPSTVVTLGPLLRLRRKKQQRKMRFKQRMTLRKFKLDKEDDQLETKKPDRVFDIATNGHSLPVQMRKPVTTLLSMTACRELSELIGSPSKWTCICSLILAFKWNMNYMANKRRIIYLLLTEFEVCTVSYGPTFFPLQFMARALRAWAINRRRQNESIWIVFKSLARFSTQYRV